MPWIDARNHPELAAAAADLNTWIDYLCHPETNDGPRIYRHIDPNAPTTAETEAQHRLSTLDDDRSYETISVLKDFPDPGVFFKSIEAVNGVDKALVQGTYDKLVRGYFTWIAPDRGPAAADGSLIEVKYPELSPTRLNWMQMRKTWMGTQDNAAYDFEGDFIRYQVYTENCVYVVAEHMVRYCAIFDKAARDIATMTNYLTERFPNPKDPNAGWQLDPLSIIVTGLIVVATTILTEGAGVSMRITIAAAVTEMLGEGVKTAKPKTQETNLKLGYHDTVAQTVQEYLDRVAQIERDVANAVNQLYDSLRTELDKLRQGRTHEKQPGIGPRPERPPRFPDYV